jgi:phage shock protein C
MKKLYRTRQNKMIAGVCGGIAEYLDVDPVLVRFIAVLFIFIYGAGFIAYILGIILIPPQPFEWDRSGDTARPDIPHRATGGNAGRIGSLIVGILLILIGAHLLLRHIPFINYYYWKLWNIGWQFFWPSLLIVLGLLVILRGTRK